MKVCSKCGLSKTDSEFFVKDKKIGRLHAQCKDCYRVHRQSYYQNHYAKYREAYLSRAKLRRETQRANFRRNMLTYLMGKACVVCGEKDVRVLELDHIKPGDKKFTISQAMRLGYKWNDVLIELKKCQILCANCHKRRTSQQFNWYKG